MTRSRTVRLRACCAAALSMVAALAVACGGDGDAGIDAAEPRRVVLVTYDSFALPEAAAAAFTERTGAEIEVVAAGDSGTMLTRALLSAGAPEGDVIFGIDDASVTRALSEDLLEPFTPEAIQRVPDRYRLDGEAGKRLVPIDRGDVCMNVDAAWFAERDRSVPGSLEDLAEPDFRDLVVVSSPVTSSPGLAFLLATIDRYGADGWEDYWARLRDNGVRVRPSWDDAYFTDYTVSGGDRPVVLSYASSPPAEVVFGDGEVTEPRSEVLVDSCAAQIEYAGVLRGAAEPELARELVEFLLSEEWQQELPLTNFVFPVTDVELPEEFRRWVPEIEDPASVPPEEIDRNRDRWIERWRELME